MKFAFAHSARSIIGRTFAALFSPPKRITPAQWAAENLKVPDGPRSGELWDPKLTPYIIEPLNNMGPDSPVTEQFIRKSAQTGFTMMAIAGVGFSIDCDPVGGMLLVQPTDKALTDFIKDKLNPTIESSPALKAKVAPQVARSGEGSTTYTKRYPGGSLAMAISNSTADLRSKTKKRIIRDEASDYPADLDGQGSPHGMIEARRESFLASGDWKDTSISTPTIVGACYIDEKFKAGDQRYWNVPCPQCDGEFAFRFGPSFKYNDTFPHDPVYEAPCCGLPILAHEKFELVRKGRWVASAPGPGKSPSYHFDAMSSPFVPWDVIAKRYINAQANPQDLKTFYNLTLGEAYEMKGDAPDHVRLMERREELRRFHVPARGLMLTAFADVQMHAIYYEVVAWAPNRESWVVDADVIVGDTTDPRRGAFAVLDEVYRREYPDAFGGVRTADAFGVDSGFRSHVVYQWCADRHKAFATKGFDGWSRPALGMPTLQDIDFGGRKITQGVKLWPVGTWSLKGHWYEDLRRPMPTDGAECFPAGYVHFGKWLDVVYFKQITSEFLAEMKSRGRMVKAWQPRGNQDNHWLDCRVGNMALADHLGVSRMTEDEWKVLARARAAKLLEQGDLFASAPLAVQAAAAAAAAVAATDKLADVSSIAPQPPKPAAAPVVEDPPPQSGGGWIGRDMSGWLR